MTKILIIIRRSNGDVLLSQPLVNALFQYYDKCSIDLLVNSDTLATAKLLNNINKIYVYDYKWKKNSFASLIKNELKLAFDIKNRYDISISLTSNKRSLLYAILASKNSLGLISKKTFVSKFLKYITDVDISKHIIENNMNILKTLGIDNRIIDFNLKLNSHKQIVKYYKYIVLHPSSQHEYKTYPIDKLNLLLEMLSKLDFQIVITGANSELDKKISNNIIKNDKIDNQIGKLTLDDFVQLANGALLYIGMDTLNTHIAAALNKKLFALYGPTWIQMWSPWSNMANCATNRYFPVQHYGNVTIFQADIDCIGCGKAGCDDRGGKSECMDMIEPQIIYNEILRNINE